MTSKSTIKKLFIANRGEILRRIGLTAKRMGIQTVAIVERGRTPAYLLDAVDHMVWVDEESTRTYLDGPQLIAMAIAEGCDAVHPGFGFLSENETFARAVETAGLIWVGPKPSAIAAMASKATARTAAEKAGVPIVPGLQNFPVPKDESGDFGELTVFARKTGYPLLIKAALGGGGKGMRLVEREEELIEAALRARSEAESSFGDGSLICEKYLGEPRHVEVQILADRHGNTFAIGDRDCSVQRRHQKVIEEAPAPGIPDKTRLAMHAAARNLAAAVGYDSTGTVEFLLDWSKASRTSNDPGFYFLEMNTRLQVEHPVTEEVFGLDLVEWQLRIAAGESLPPEIGERVPQGHSLEVRLYAEDPCRNYLPQPGPVAAFFPATGPGLRWETGLDTTDEITGNFDPMIAKLIVTGPTRLGAIDRMVQALENTLFAGPANNLEWVRLICRHTEFRDGPVDTSFLGRRHDMLVDLLEKDRARHADQADQWLAAADEIFGSSNAQNQDAAVSATVSRAFGATVTPGTRSLVALARHHYSGKNGAVSVAHVAESLPSGTQHGFLARQVTAEISCDFASLEGRLFQRERLSSRIDPSLASGPAGGGELCAPVPGKVVAIKAKLGQQIEEGQAVFILESMKMEFEVKASRSGNISEFLVAIGDQVKAGIRLAIWEE